MRKRIEIKPLDICTLVISIISLIVSGVVGCYQYKLDKSQKELEEIFYPINYTISLSDKKFEYQFNDTKIEQYYPNIEFVTGRPHKAAVIISKENDYIIASCSILPDNKYSISNIKTEMPRDEFDYNTQYVYDYFFLYLEDANNNVLLDLIYYEIDLKNYTISEPMRYSKVDLIRLDASQTNYYEKEMLMNYKNLLDKIKELGI